jgi:arylsulfatase
MSYLPLLSFGPSAIVSGSAYLLSPPFGMECLTRLADDRVYGGGVLRGAATPRIDKLAAEGTRLLNFNVEAQYTPSRACLLTGRYAVRTGNGSVPIDTPLYGLVQWEYTMAEMLSDAGYATGMFGKWHLGHTEGRMPVDQGFDEWFGIPNSTDESFWPDNPLFDPKSDPYAKLENIMQGVIIMMLP